VYLGFDPVVWRNIRQISRDNIYSIRGKLTELRDVDKFATRGGSATTVGITLPEAMRWERVILSSEFGHIMTIGEFAIVLPNPLGMDKTISY